MVNETTVNEKDAMMETSHRFNDQPENKMRSTTSTREVIDSRGQTSSKEITQNRDQTSKKQVTDTRSQTSKDISQNRGQTSSKDITEVRGQSSKSDISEIRDQSLTQSSKSEMKSSSTSQTKSSSSAVKEISKSSTENVSKSSSKVQQQVYDEKTKTWKEVNEKTLKSKRPSIVRYVSQESDGSYTTIYKRKIFDARTRQWKVVDEKVFKDRRPHDTIPEYPIDDTTNRTTTTYTTKVYDTKTGTWKVVDEQSFTDTDTFIPKDIVQEIERDHPDLANITTTTEITKVSLRFKRLCFKIVVFFDWLGSKSFSSFSQSEKVMVQGTLDYAHFQDRRKPLEMALYTLTLWLYILYLF